MLCPGSEFPLQRTRHCQTLEESVLIILPDFNRRSKQTSHLQLLINITVESVLLDNPWDLSISSTMLASSLLLLLKVRYKHFLEDNLLTNRDPYLKVVVEYGPSTACLRRREVMQDQRMRKDVGPIAVLWSVMRTSSSRTGWIRPQLYPCHCSRFIYA